MKTKRISKYLNINELVSLRCLSHLVAELTHVPIIILSSPTWVFEKDLIPHFLQLKHVLKDPQVTVLLTLN